MPTIKRNSKEEIRNALIGAIKACGLPEPKDELLRNKTLKFKSKEEILAATSTVLLAIGINEFTKRRKVKDEAHLDRRLEQIRKAPFQFKPLLDKVLTELRKAATGKPRGPRPQLSEAQQRKARTEIAGWKSQGMPIKWGIEQKARELGISVRLMRKYYERGKP